MNIRTVLLAVFVALTVVFASVALYESTARAPTISVTNTVTSSTASSLSSSTCAPPGPLPPNPLGGGGFISGTTFAFVGGNSTCVEVAPSAPGLISTSDFAFTLNATRQLLLTMNIDTNGGYGVSTVPNGTSFIATVGSQSFDVYQTLRTSPILFTIPSGITSFDFQVSVPNPYPPGAYHFVILITAWSDTTRSYAIYGDEFRANLVAR